MLKTDYWRTSIKNINIMSKVLFWHVLNSSPEGKAADATWIQVEYNNWKFSDLFFRTFKKKVSLCEYKRPCWPFVRLVLKTRLYAWTLKYVKGPMSWLLTTTDYKTPSWGCYVHSNFCNVMIIFFNFLMIICYLESL